MMEELDRFVLTEDLPEEGLQAGDLGTIVMVHTPGGDYEGTGGIHRGIYVFDRGNPSGG
jgi:hypothetical protein